MALKLQSDSDFKPLLEHLAGDLAWAGIYFKLHQNLVKSKNTDYQREFNEAWGFWWLTLGALMDAVVFRICRAYDHNRDSINFRNLLELIAERRDLFETEKFRERMKDNPHVDSLAEGSRVPPKSQLDADLDFVQCKSNPMVLRLITWRDKFYAHRDPEMVLQPAEFEPLLISEVETLLEQGRHIVNRYTMLFNANTHAAWMIGEDSYITVLKSMQEQLARYDAEFKRDLALAGMTEDEGEADTTT